VTTCAGLRGSTRRPNLEQQLAALKGAGFKAVDCFWKDLQRALFGGYA